MWPPAIVAVNPGEAHVESPDLVEQNGISLLAAWQPLGVDDEIGFVGIDLDDPFASEQFPGPPLAMHHAYEHTRRARRERSGLVAVESVLEPAQCLADRGPPIVELKT